MPSFSIESETRLPSFSIENDGEFLFCFVCLSLKRFSILDVFLL